MTFNTLQKTSKPHHIPLSIHKQKAMQEALKAKMTIRQRL
jgi:hypothetical protein